MLLRPAWAQNELCQPLEEKRGAGSRFIGFTADGNVGSCKNVILLDNAPSSDLYFPGFA
jgi:hypothetical protein